MLAKEENEVTFGIRTTSTFSLQKLSNLQAILQSGIHPDIRNQLSNTNSIFWGNLWHHATA